MLIHIDVDSLRGRPDISTVHSFRGDCWTLSLESLLDSVKIVGLRV